MSGIVSFKDIKKVFFQLFLTCFDHCFVIPPAVDLESFVEDHRFQIIQGPLADLLPVGSATLEAGHLLTRPFLPLFWPPLRLC